ncbi:PREDICTED: uncharacterized protein LOC104709284 [Camelina sativa]|uniref:Uncharacterized protein LOC104709284 n=1 Tax=Camelina sativa TaxID=90675 RepID=A0ABM0TCK5_CAMSA|nr:PREDICTED: uncharacterized protein LOC104709284 [Camelina sativa]
MTTTNDGQTPPVNPTPNPTATSTTTTKEVRHTIYSYDLTAADNPGAVISHPLLTGTNYDEWSCGMKTALCSRKKFGFLNRVIPRPDEGSPNLEDWWTIKALLVSWIKISVGPPEEEILVTNGPRVQQIKADLVGCKQRGLTIEAYFGKLTRIWDSMASYRPLRLCKCGRCECDLGMLQERDREEDKVHQFLFGLDDTLYLTVRSSLVSRILIQPMEEIYNTVLQEEDLLKNGANSREKTAEVSAFVVHAMQRVRKEGKDKHVVCKHFTDRPRSRASQSQGRGHGGFNGGAGRGRGITFANAVQVAAPSGSTNANYVVTDNDRDKVQVSDAQWRAIKNLLNADILTDVRDMAPVGFVLADGRERILVKEGSVRLGPNFLLQSVYFVEEFQSELISLSQLMDENQCVVQLADHFLVVQDRILRTVTGFGKRLGGTFHFRSLEYTASITVRDAKSFELRHNRMGHPAAKVVGLLHGVSHNISSTILNKVCDTFLHAKQTRLSFPISENKTTDIFEWIHCDLWGPYRTPMYSGARFFLTIVDDYSRSVWIHLLNEKSEAPTQLKNFLTITTRQFNTQVQKIRSDNGSEFVCLRNFVNTLGIVHETSCFGTPQ